jgi:hypothetical protein
MKKNERSLPKKSLDAENRKNIAEIGRLHRLTQAANRAVCQKCSMRANCILNPYWI